MAPLAPQGRRQGLPMGRDRESKRPPGQRVPDGQFLAGSAAPGSDRHRPALIDAAQPTGEQAGVPSVLVRLDPRLPDEATASSTCSKIGAQALGLLDGLGNPGLDDVTYRDDANQLATFDHRNMAKALARHDFHDVLGTGAFATGSNPACHMRFYCVRQRLDAPCRYRRDNIAF